MKIWHWYIDLKTVSEANSSEHWTKKAKRHRLQKMKIKAALLQERPHIQLPCAIHLTRIAPRTLDVDDNLPMAFKFIKDAIADYIIPGQAPGRADDCKSIVWRFKQEKGQPKQMGVRIEIIEGS